MKYTKEHEWLRAEGDEIVVGITRHAAEQLGDVVYVGLPSVGERAVKGFILLEIESVKAAAEILAPCYGEIVAVNDKIAENPALVNEDPLGAGWFIKIKPENPAVIDEYLDEAEYRKLVE
ncbi:MAG: glycine cleavage system protein GcvH [Albidovulum sp.]|nr:glycine cleavage system protein GcvH [Albidovulum sp.]